MSFPNDAQVIAYPLDVCCMIGDHGRLYGYVGVDGKVFMRPCDHCIEEAVAAFKALVRTELGDGR